MPNEQAKYMDLNEFLQTFFTAQDNREDHVGYFPNMVKDDLNVQNLQQQISHIAQSMGPNSRKLFKQYWDARNDNSPAAADFLNMVKTITVWYADSYGRQNLKNYCQNIMMLCQNGKIKNPTFALRLLKCIESQMQGDSSLRTDINYMIATNPAAKPVDVYTFARIVGDNKQSKYYQDAPTELMKMLNDQMVRVDSAIDAEMSKDFPNIENIQKSGAATLPEIAHIMCDIARNLSARPGSGITAQDVEQLFEVERALKQKYSMEKILNLEFGNYTQQFEDAASLRLAKIEPQYDKMERDLGAAQKSYREMRGAYDEQTRQIRELQDKIEKLESELRTEKSKNATLRATIKTFIIDAESRANGGVVNIRKDMLEQIQKLKNNMEQGRVSI